MVTTIYFLKFFSWLPIGLIAGGLLFAGRRTSPAWLFTPLLAGFTLGLALFLGLPDLSIAGLLASASFAALIVLLAVQPKCDPLFAALAFIAGFHLAVLATSEDTGDAFWALPLIDVWVFVGIPALLLALLITLARRRKVA